MKPEPVTELARAKVNLALHITGRREDGYHELDSIVAFASIGDRLTFYPSSDPGISISYQGPFGDALRRAGDDIVLKAASLLQQRCNQAETGLHVTLEKNLPLSSGIGGGSADAAAALRGLVRLWRIDISEAELLAMALKIGADLPVCLLSRPTRMAGIGGHLEPLSSFPSFHAVLVNPGTPLATKAVFAELGLGLGHRGFDPILKTDQLTACRNDLETPAMKLVPEIADVLAALRRQPGMSLARMSGSGATCFGLFEEQVAADKAAQQIGRAHPSWWTAATTLS